MTQILVIDDSLTVRMDLADALGSAGFEVLSAASLAEAWRVLAREQVDLAVLDVQLPDGDGIEFLEELRRHARFTSVPVLVLSTASDIKDRVRAMRTGATDFVGKPYDRGAVVARVRQLTREREAATAARVSGPSILVIDDSLTFREALREALAEAGYAPNVASSGTEGLRIAALLRPAAIIVDGVMPDIDGETVIRRLRLDPALRATPCLLLTGSSEAESETRALYAGADAFARKEQELEVILARLGTMLRHAQSEAVPSPSLAGPSRVILVERDPAFAERLGDAMRIAGYDVVRAAGGEDAIDLLSMQDVDCVLVDWEAGSADVCRRVKASLALRGTPVIALADTDRASVLDVFDAGADDSVARDAPADLVCARVHAQIRRRRVEDEQRVIRERVLRGELADQLEKANAELVEANRELEAFSYSVSHDLRTPLRAIAGFAEALEEDLADRLDDASRDHLARLRRSTLRMSEMIEALLELSRVGRAAMQRRPVDVSALAQSVCDDLSRAHPDRRVKVSIEPGLATVGDPRLLRIVLDNLIGNAWKFTARSTDPRIAIATPPIEPGFVIHDNGVGFDMTKAEKLFAPFQRLHVQSDFAGTGIGLATVRRIVERHGGRIWAEGAPGSGASFYIALPD